MQINSTLYKKSSTGKILLWSIFANEDVVTIIRGQEDGKMVQTDTTSVAKQNTTASEQAIKEATAKWKKQLKKNYVEDKADLDTPAHLLAPLAKKYQDHAKHVDYENGAICMTKYDGVRMTAFWRDGKAFFQTRGGESYPVIKEMADELYARFWSKSEALVIDGEIYEHDMYLEDITAAVKKHNEDTPRLKFYIFDLHNPLSPEIPYLERLFTVCAFIEDDKRLRVAKWFMCHSEQLMLAYHDTVVADGFEGIILRAKNSLFEFGTRNTSFIKYKVRHRAEYVTVKPVLCKNGSVKIMCKVVVKGEVKFFSPPMLGELDFQREVYDNWDKFNTGHGTIEYEAISKYGIPAKAKFISFRVLDSKGNPTE